MIGVDLIGQIRRAYFEQRRSIKEIVRLLSVSRATVRKVVRGQETEFKYERSVQPAPKLGDWIEVLTGILEAEAKLPRRERRSTQRLFEELRGRGYDGAHDSVHRFVKAWRDERARVPAQAFVPMSFAPGDAYQFDSHELLGVKNFYLHIAISFLSLMQYSRSEPNCATRPVSRTGSNSHSVAVRNGCTTIPLALRQRLRRTRPFWSSASKPNQTSVRSPGSAGIDQPR